MRAQELRVGNYVGTPVGIKRVVSIVSSADGSTYDIRTSTRAVYGEDNLFVSSRLYPILLTEELLLKSGFRKFDGCRDSYGSFELGHFEVTKSIDDGLFYPTFNGHEYIIGDVPTNFLHQLQNLYFLLVGEELEVKF